MYPNIAICGAMRAGKDEAAKYLSEKYGYNRFAFGDELKRFVYEIFGPPEDGHKPRELLQWFGQTMRQRDPSVWVRKCFDAIEWKRNEHEAAQRGFVRHSSGRIAPIPFRAVITDVRQPNEHGRCRAEGFVIVRVNCPDDIRILRAQAAGDTFSFADLLHETEQHVDTFAVDYELDNSGSLADLHAQIDAMLRAFAESDA